MYKNWEIICKITDTHFMWALALLNLDSSLGQHLIKQLPEFFTQKEQSGPIPLSAIYRKASENHLANSESFSEEFVVSNEADKYFNIPIITFGIDTDALEYDDNAKPLPNEIKEKALETKNREVGTVFQWHGKSIMVLEYNEHTGIFYFAPTELIAVDK